MDDYEPVASFGADRAETYDVEHVRGDEDDTVAFLAELADGWPALELAIGTGRIALPLAARGVAVEGVELSPAMVDRLRAKPGGADLPVVVGDMAEVPGDSRFGLVYVVFNTLFNLLTQDAQVACFQRAAEHLVGGGAFVVEGGVPAPLYGLRNDQYVDAEAIGVGEVRLDVGRFDPVTQVLEESHVSLSATGVRVAPIVTRYSWPSELDLMARLAGLRLAERWGSWSREPFRATSTNAISVYRR